MGTELLGSIDIIIALCYFLLSFVIVALPFAVKPLRVLKLWGAIMAFHAIIFLTGCGIHHLQWSSHELVGEDPVQETVHHFLLPATMQIYGALGVSAVLVFRGRKMGNNLVRELVRIDHEAELLDRRTNGNH